MPAPDLVASDLLDDPVRKPPAFVAPALVAPALGEPDLPLPAELASAVRALFLSPGPGPDVLMDMQLPSVGGVIGIRLYV